MKKEIDWEYGWDEDDEDLSNISLGDRVVCKKGRSIGKEGRVISIEMWTKVVLCGVEFDEVIDGHNCEGKGKTGHCRYIILECLDKI